MDRATVREMKSGASALGVEQGQPEEPGEGVSGNRHFIAKDPGGRQATKAKWRGGHISIRASRRSSLPASFGEMARRLRSH